MNSIKILTDQAIDLNLNPPSSNLTETVPIHRLPPEVISDVFLRSLPVDSDKPPRPSPLTAPTLFTHVCSSWRKIAIDTHSLWCRIEVGVGVEDVFEQVKGLWGCTKPHPRPAQDAKVLEEWTKRSGSMPLTIHIGYLAEPELSYDRPVEIIMNVAHRWKDMILGIPASYLQRAIALIPAGTPLLETFAMNDRSIPRWVPYKVKPPPKRPLSLDFATSPLPLLKGLSIRGTVQFDFTIPLSALQTLSLDHCSPSNSLEILRNCPNVEDLTLVYYDLIHSDELSLPETTILLSRVQIFRLVHTRYNDEPLDDEDFMEIGELLDHLCVPSLKFFFYRIGILPYDDEGPDEWDYLSRLICRSNCYIEELEFEIIRIDGASVVSCLMLSPGLKHLGVTAALDEELVDALDEPSGHTITTYMCPLLESFHLIDWPHSISLGDTEHVLKIARSRLCLPIGQEGRIARFSFISDQFDHGDPLAQLEHKCRVLSRLPLLQFCLDNGLEVLSGTEWRENREKQGLRL
ncbi:hypothetical protein BD410DRAFT_794128 [Rickenella mellea]|uniref:Uncharacterized protein n=1 Tax=Rickenella mellea TaxID=50990 RepID=A0A4Y7PSX2_9AGAM|nr:hypothetical protein BD410DRAFT_794128 [Rickenella mellea]